ncbi:STAS domain-containing protein [Actinomadura hibisca]|uniref:STAS domain-containing protein n=1 Tax=Actinomadura hibisca TaxID=68565 RepID=UPI000A001134|nr:STAS domain-containing protein [Actinomadura hibisca]
MTDDNTAVRRTSRRPAAVRCGGAPEADRGVGAVRVREGRAWADPSWGEPPELRVTVARTRGETAVAAVTGEIDLRTADTLRARLVELHAAGFRTLVVDFAGVPFCDATGLGALVAVHNHLAEQGGEIRLARVRPAQRRLLHITGLYRLFPVEDEPGSAPGGVPGHGGPSARR